jgi:hypothetical protein
VGLVECEAVDDGSAPGRGELVKGLKVWYCGGWERGLMDRIRHFSGTGGLLLDGGK